MFLFIYFERHFQINRSVFKYISCSYLSYPKCQIRIFSFYLNTSHVLIYHWLKDGGYMAKEFKYISCSYLSTNQTSASRLPLAFKYISCSYLSEKSGTSWKRKQGFKYISCSYLSIFCFLTFKKF